MMYIFVQVVVLAATFAVATASRTPRRYVGVLKNQQWRYGALDPVIIPV
jgi:hypothetical protein